MIHRTITGRAELRQVQSDAQRAHTSDSIQIETFQSRAPHIKQSDHLRPFSLHVLSFPSQHIAENVDSGTRTNTDGMRALSQAKSQGPQPPFFVNDPYLADADKTFPPCQRCSKKNISCTYAPVADEQLSPVEQQPSSNTPSALTMPPSPRRKFGSPPATHAGFPASDVARPPYGDFTPELPGTKEILQYSLPEPRRTWSLPQPEFRHYDPTIPSSRGVPTQRAHHIEPPEWRHGRSSHRDYITYPYNMHPGYIQPHCAFARLAHALVADVDNELHYLFSALPVNLQASF
ncbi:hypothetical protein C8R43DRAFT_940467 [Mycena crocata]|nr:hypothetical protein C8R43DRAFT_940467 [Mycena crocata]